MLHPACIAAHVSRQADQLLACNGGCCRLPWPAAASQADQTCFEHFAEAACAAYLTDVYRGNIGLQAGQPLCLDGSGVRHTSACMNTNLHLVRCICMGEIAVWRS
jgi:hypothetical protein